MATDARDTAAPVAEGLPEGVDPQSVFGALFREGYHFSFYQAVWLLEALLDDAPAPGEVSEVWRERIRFRPSEDMIFPAADVQAVTWDEVEKWAEVVVTFMGLYGVASPLPVYFYKALSQGQEEYQALRDFLDIFNHRLYSYFYRGWKKYRPGLLFERSYENEHAQRFLSLAGVGTPDAALEAFAPLRLAAFAGRLGPHVRNAEGLKALVEGMVPPIRAEVVENVPRWVPVAQRPGLGKQARVPLQLGENALVGGRLYDVSGKFRLRLGPLTLEQFQALSPGGPLARQVHRLVRLYVPDYLDYDVELLLDVPEAPALRLGDRNAKLGINTWIGRPTGEMISEIAVYGDG